MHETKTYIEHSYSYYVWKMLRFSILWHSIPFTKKKILVMSQYASSEWKILTH